MRSGRSASKTVSDVTGASGPCGGAWLDSGGAGEAGAPRAPARTPGSANAGGGGPRAGGGPAPRQCAGPGQAVRGGPLPEADRGSPPLRTPPPSSPGGGAPRSGRGLEGGPPGGPARSAASRSGLQRRQRHDPAPVGPPVRRGHQPTPPRGFREHLGHRPGVAVADPLEEGLARPPAASDPGKVESVRAGRHGVVVRAQTHAARTAHWPVWTNASSWSACSRSPIAPQRASGRLRPSIASSEAGKNSLR